MINIGIIGFGYWGPNIVRNFLTFKQVNVKVICDQHAHALKRARETYPFITTTERSEDVLLDASIDAVAIVTPVSTHFTLAKQALMNGKHVFIEKPLTASSKEAAILIDLARRKKLQIMVGHTFIFTGAVQKIKETIDTNVLGKLYYYDTTRINLGIFQHDVSVIWDLAPHDFAIIDHVIKNKPTAISVQGIDHMGHGQENIAYITLFFTNNLIAHININWLSPVKLRTTLIGGEKKMLFWDDLKEDEKIKIYDRGVTVGENQDMIYRRLIDYRVGDMVSPKIERHEALNKELAHFIECVEQDKTPINSGLAGLRIVRLLELAEKSVKHNGRLIKIQGLE